MGTSNISMSMFNSYVSLEEGIEDYSPLKCALLFIQVMDAFPEIPNLSW